MQTLNPVDARRHAGRKRRDVHTDAERFGPARRGVAGQRPSATGTITDDDPLTVAVSADAETVVEGGAATFTMSASGGDEHRGG